MLSEAAKKMWDHDCGCLVVLNGKGEPSAMLTDRDICMAAYTRGEPLWRIPVAVAASGHLYCVYDHDNVEIAEAMMRGHRVRRLPVIDWAGRAVGMLSMNDIVRHARRGRHHDKSLSPESIVETLAIISTPESEAIAHAAE
jgi:CBS domain-containing protein